MDKEIYRLRKSNRLRQFLIILMAVCSIAGICYVLSPYIHYRVVALILLVTVSIVAMVFDIFPVLLAAFLSALIWNFFFIPPKFTFSINSTEDTLMFMMYFIIAMVNGALTYKIRQVEKQSLKKEEKEKILKLYNTLFNSLSHELQTPISTIIGATDTLKENPEKLTDKSKEELIREIATASLRLNEQVGNLLNMSRLETGHLRLKKDWCDINELLYSVVNKIDDKKSNRKIQIRVPENFPFFKLDFGIMEQVLYNLVNNAVQYTPDNSAITLEAKYTTSIEGHFDEMDEESAAHRDFTKHILTITVSDNGKGFPEDELERAFDKFYRLDSSQTGGTGLGLSIAKGFVEAHQGKIHLQNQLQGGARFIIEIPAEASYVNALKHE